MYSFSRYPSFGEKLLNESDSAPRRAKRAPQAAVSASLVRHEKGIGAGLILYYKEVLNY
jgi:hypothetical protein